MARIFIASLGLILLTASLVAMLSRRPRLPYRVGLVCALTTFALVAAMSTPAFAKDCKVGRSDRLELLDWSSEPEHLGPLIRFKLKSNLPKAVRSVSAELVFEDAAGNDVATMPLNPGIRIAAGAERSEEDAILNAELNGVLKREDMTAKICTRYVVYSDGVFDEF